MQRIFHTPEGVRDIYGEECSRKKRLQKELHQVFSRYGYEDIETPGFEYFEVFRKLMIIWAFMILRSISRMRYIGQLMKNYTEKINI